MQRECLPKGFKQNLEFLETMKVALRVMLDALNLSNTEHLALLGSKCDFKKLVTTFKTHLPCSSLSQVVTRHSLSFQFIQALMHGVT